MKKISKVELWNTKDQFKITIRSIVTHFTEYYFSKQTTKRNQKQKTSFRGTCEDTKTLQKRYF